MEVFSEFKSGKINFYQFLDQISAEIRENLEKTTADLLQTAQFLRSINDLMGGDLYD